LNIIIIDSKTKKKNPKQSDPWIQSTEFSDEVRLESFIMATLNISEESERDRERSRERRKVRKGGGRYSAGEEEAKKRFET
jgi:hypothetical protein